MSCLVNVKQFTWTYERSATQHDNYLCVMALRILRCLAEVQQQWDVVALQSWERCLNHEAGALTPRVMFGLWV